MDAIRMEKFRAMKRYKRRRQFNIPTLFKYLVGILLVGLFLSSPLWLPKLRWSLNLLFVAVLPNVITSLFGPKCLFIVCNLIVVFLVSESRLSGTYSMPDVYEEFVRRNTAGSRTRSNSTVVAGKRGGAFMQIGLAGGVQEEGEGKGGGEVEGVEGGCCWEMEEEDDEDLVHEWNRRFEDFIAKVRKQRRLEAKRMPLCYWYG